MTVGHPLIHWFEDPSVLAPILLMVGLYVWRFREVRREGDGRGATWLHALAFAAAVLALLGAPTA